MTTAQRPDTAGTKAAPSEALWLADAAVLHAADTDPTYREALIAWFALHRIDANRVAAAAITANEDGYLALQVTTSAYVDRQLQTYLDIRPLLADPPALHPGWQGPLAASAEADQ